jgi:exodeoxyribonuclease-1
MVDESNSEEETLDEVELQIYDGFANRADSSLMEKFHQGSGQNKIEVLRGLEDLRMKRLAQRLLYFEYPELLSDKVKSAMKDKIQKRLTVSEEVPWRTIDKARAELESLGDPMIGSEGEKFVQDYQSLLDSCEE